MRKFVVPVIIVFAAATTLAFSNGLDVTQVTIHTDEAQYQVNAEIADSFSSQIKGLMGRWRLPVDQGMLFVYREPSKLRFWMKNMRISLDIWFIDENKTIRHMANQVPPCRSENCPRYQSPVPVQYVLEVQSGFAKRFDVQVGDRVTFELPNAQ